MSICCWLLILTLACPGVIAQGKSQLSGDVESFAQMLERATQARAADPRLIIDLNLVLEELQLISHKLEQISPETVVATSGIDLLGEDIEKFQSAITQARTNRSARVELLAELDEITSQLIKLQDQLAYQDDSSSDIPLPTEDLPLEQSPDILGQGELPPEFGGLQMDGIVGALLPLLLGLSKPKEEPKPAEDKISSEQELISMLADIGVDYHELSEQEKETLRQEYLK